MSHQSLPGSGLGLARDIRVPLTLNGDAPPPGRQTCRGWGHRGRERTERAYRPELIIPGREDLRVNDGFNFQEKTSNWEGDSPGELTVPQTDTGEQVEYTRARRENHVEGTRQNDPVTSGEGVLSPLWRGKRHR